MKPNFLLAAALALLAGSASATSLSVSVGPPAVHVGDTFALDVLVDDVAGLYAYQFDLAFDPSIVRAVDVAEGSLLASGGAATSFAPGAIDNLFGTVLFTGNTLLGPAPGASGGGVLARLRFQALAEGLTPLSLGNVVLLDAALDGIGGTAFGRSIEVTAVAEPASALLAGLGLAALAATLRGRAQPPGHSGPDAVDPEALVLGDARAQLGRREAGDAARLAAQVRLVGIAGVGRHVGPAHRLVAFGQGADEGLLRTAQAAAARASASRSSP